MEERIEIRDIRDPGWFYIDNEIIDKYGAELGVYGIAVYTILARHAHHSSQRAWPSVSTMAERLGTARRKIIEAIEKLEELNLIKVERSRGRSNIYTLLKVKTSSAPELVDVQKCTTSSAPELPSSAPELPPVPPRNSNNTHITTLNNNNKRGVVVASSLSSQEETAKRFLMEQGVSEHMAQKLALEISPTRILEVVLAANKKTNIKEKSAWIVQALQQGWALSFEPEKPQTEEEKLIAEGKYLVRDPRTGKLLTPEEMEKLGR